jgi:putative molybdopterin biosynthesis protein
MTAGSPTGPARRALSEWLECCTDSGWTPAGLTELVEPAGSVGRVTASAVYAIWSSPADERAAMDGIAVRAGDTTGASAEHPVRLEPARYDVVDTGDPVPAGRDAVIMREHIRRGADGVVEIVAAASVGRHVRPVGEDVTRGEFLLPAGHRIRPVDAAVAAAAGHTRLPVRRRPVVAVIPTGDEVRPVGTVIGPGEVLDTNSLMLAGMAREAGGTPLPLPVTPDEPAALAAAVLAVAEAADLILVIAGSSAGRDDHTAGVLATLGKVAVHGVAIRPGHPVVLGVVDAPSPVPVIGVPGYPVSAAHVFGIFAAPVLAALQGVKPAAGASTTATLAEALSSPAHLEEWVPVVLQQGPHTVLAVPTGRGAGALSALMRADGVVRVAAGTSGLDAGDEVQVELLGGPPPGHDPG